MLELHNFFEDARRYAQAKRSGSASFKTREPSIRDALQFAAKQKIRMILCDPREAYKMLDEIKKSGAPVVLDPTLALPVADDDHYDQPFTTPSQLYKSGIQFAFASFSNEFSRDLPYQAAAAVPFGLPKEEALKAITINAAQTWGVANQMGSVEEGKVADFMLTDGDPLEIQTHVEHVFIQGKSVDLDNKQKRLYEKYEKRP